MKRLKRIFAVLLSVALVVTMLPLNSISVNADEEPEPMVLDSFNFTIDWSKVQPVHPGDSVQSYSLITSKEECVNSPLNIEASTRDWLFDNFEFKNEVNMKAMFAIGYAYQTGEINPSNGWSADFTEFEEDKEYAYFVLVMNNFLISDNFDVPDDCTVLEYSALGGGFAIIIPLGTTEEIEEKVLDTQHNWDEGTITIQPTISSKGEIEYKCLDAGCTETKKKELPNIVTEIHSFNFEIDWGEVGGVSVGASPEVPYFEIIDKEGKYPVSLDESTSDWFFDNYDVGSVSGLLPPVYLAFGWVHQTGMEIPGHPEYKGWTGFTGSFADGVEYAYAAEADGDFILAKDFSCPEGCIALDFGSYVDDSGLIHGRGFGLIIPLGTVEEIEEKVIDASHNWDSGTVTKAPTCMEEGEMLYCCTDDGCTETKTTAIPKSTQHTWDAGTITTTATCIQKGVKTFSCTIEGCTETTTEEIPALDHKWNEGTVTKEPTCSEKGIRTYACTNEGCTETTTEEIPALNHKWNEGTVTKEPTCSEKGIRTYACTNEGCIETATEEIPTIEHKWDEGVVITPATCTEKGIKLYSCTTEGCVETITEDIPALNHKWDEGKITKEPSYTEKGIKKYTCINAGCTETIDEELPMLQEPAPKTAGSISTETTIAPESPVESASLNNAVDDLEKASGIFSDEEKVEIEQGKDAQVWLEITDANEALLSNEDKQKIDAFVEENTTPEKMMLFEVNLFKKVGEKDAESVHEPGIDVSVTLSIPESMVNHDENIEREYGVFRLSDGKVTNLESEYNEGKQELTVKTNHFSTYGIYYKDKVKPSPSPAPTPTPDPEPDPNADAPTPNNNPGRKSPKTGECVDVRGYLVSGLLLIFVLAFWADKKQERKRILGSSQQE